MKAFHTKVPLNDIIGVEDLRTSGIISENNDCKSKYKTRDIFREFRLFEANAFEGGA